MATRIRTRGFESTSVITLDAKMINVTTGGTVFGQTPRYSFQELVSPAYEIIEDITGSQGSDHMVSHTRRETQCGILGQTVVVKSPIYFVGAIPHQDVYTGRFPVGSLLRSQDAHLGMDSGIRALAIARVPAYAQEEINAFVSLMEARELVDSTALKSAAGLARMAVCLYKSARGGTLKSNLSREAKRILDALRKTGNPLEAKRLWTNLLSVLTGLNQASMEWKYGIKPMINDLQGASDAVRKLGLLHEELVKGKRVYGRATETRNSSYRVDYGFPGSLAGIESVNLQVDYQKTTQTTAVASIVRALNPANPMFEVDWFNQLDVVLEVNGLNPSLKSWWQLSNLTFITDWFWNVSDLLESLQTLEAPVGSNFTSHSGLFSLKRETTVTGSGRFVNSSGSTAFSGMSSNKTYTRNTDSLTESPALYIPPLRLPTKAGQWFSMAQIAFQRFLGKDR